MRNSVRSRTALIAAALVAFHTGALAQTIRTPAPVRAVDLPSEAVQSKIPRPLERSSNALAKLGLQPTDLQLGRSETFTVARLHSRSGELTANAVNIAKSSDGHWVIRGYPGGGAIRISFATERGKRYLVDFAVDTRIHTFYASVMPGFSGRRSEHGVEDGHVGIIVSGTGARHSITLSPKEAKDWFTLYYVKVTPQTN